MNNSYVTLIGNLGQDPIPYKTGEGASFSLAVKYTRPNVKGEHEKKVMWIKCLANGKLGQNALNFLKKGDQITIMGSLIDNYQMKWLDDKNPDHAELIRTGQKVMEYTQMAINVSNLHFPSTAPRRDGISPVQNVEIKTAVIEGEAPF